LTRSPNGPKEKATVRALRAEAADVDVQPRSMGRRKAESSEGVAAALATQAAKGRSEN